MELLGEAWAQLQKYDVLFASQVDFGVKMDHYTYIDNILLNEFYTQVLYNRKDLVDEIENKLSRSGAVGRISLNPSVTIQSRQMNVLPFDEKIYLIKILEDFIPKLIEDQTVNPFSSLKGRFLFGNVKVSHIQFEEGILVMIPAMSDLDNNYIRERIGDGDNTFIIIGDKTNTWNNRHKVYNELGTSAYARFSEMLFDHRLFRGYFDEWPDLSDGVRQLDDIYSYLVDFEHYCRGSFKYGEFNGLFLKREFIKGCRQNVTILYPIYLVDSREFDS